MLTPPSESAPRPRGWAKAQPGRGDPAAPHRRPELAEGPAGASMTGTAVAPGPELVSAAARRAAGRRLRQRAAGGPVELYGGWG
jgi:hypothetical protein